MKNVINYFQDYQKDIKVVLCDIYDTILLRSIHPEYVKRIWAKKIKHIFSLTIDGETIYQLRNRFEIELCRINQTKGFDGEFTYTALCEKLFDVFSEKQQLGVKAKEFAQICLRTELNIEKTIQRVDADFVMFAEKLKQKNIPLYCVSDFYLSGEIIQELFKFHKIDHLICNQFISSDYLLTKRSGRLYDLIKSELKLQSEDFLMIGDNKHSDYRMAQSKGIKTYLVERNDIQKFYKQQMTKALNKKEIEKTLAKLVLNGSKDIPFQQLVYTFYYFIEKLHARLVAKHVSNVFFLSREGEYLKKLFDQYQHLAGFENKQFIKSHYLLVSRRSTYLPSLQNLDKECFTALFQQYFNISPLEFLFSLGFEEDEIRTMAGKSIDVFHNKVTHFPNSNIYKDIITSKKFQEIYERKRSEQRANFISYLKSFDVDYISEGLNLVDVGWKGSIQDNIFGILEDVQVNGYYLGLISSGAMSSRNTKEGIVFSCLPPRSRFYKVYNENRALFEIVLGASHGSAVSYEANEPRVIMKQEKLEKELFNTKILPMQEHMTDIFNAMCMIMRTSHYSYKDLEIFFAKKHANMVWFPSRQMLSFFQDLYHFENFGLFEITKFNDPCFNMKQWIRNFISLILKPRATLRRGFWIPLTLKSLGFSFLNPVYGIYRYWQTFKVGKN